MMWNQKNPGPLGKLGNFVARSGGIIAVIGLMAVVYYFVLFLLLPMVTESPEEFLGGELLCWIAHYLIIMISINIAAFQYFKKYNCVSHWQRQSCVADLFRQCKDIDTVDPEEGASFDSKLPYSHYCHSCKWQAPVRSHHCPLCQMCVMRKDHHCFVISGCVGLGNQRFFITTLFWLSVGLLVFLYYLSIYVGRHPETGDLLPFGWLRIIGPIGLVRWFFGYGSLSFAMLGVFYSFYISGCFSATGFFGMQVFYTAHGYTMFEYHNTRPNDAFDGDGFSVNERMRLVFGRYWALNFVFPLVWEQPVLTPEIADNLFRVRSKIM